MDYSAEFAKLWYRMSQELRIHMEQELGSKLTEGQLNVIEFILNHDQVKPSDLLSHLATTPAAVTTLLDRMEKNGLIERERDQQDRRIVWIHLTEKGKTEGERGLKIRKGLLEGMLGRISSHNQQLLVYLLGKVASL